MDKYGLIVQTESGQGAQVECEPCHSLRIALSLDAIKAVGTS